MGLFIPTNKLENLKLYKYSSEDHSLISRYIMKRWWNSFVKIFPMNMAPNVITLLGLVWILANLACVFYYDPYLNTPSPRWCYFFYAIGLFMYQTFDGCDGCHARRTGQSGPLGELFDHSIDAINTTLGSLVFGSVFQLGYGWLMFIAQLASVCNFYTSTWEEYHTHTLYLSQFSGPVEGILIICILYIVTGIFGPGIWDMHLFDLDLTSLGYGLGVYEVSTSIFYVVGGLGQLYFNISSAMKNVLNKYKSSNKVSDNAAQSMVYEASKGLIPFFAYYATILFLIFSFPEVITTYGFPLIISIGFTIAFCVGRIILAHLTLQKFPFFQPPTFLPILQLAVAKFLINLYGYDRANTLSAIMWTGVGATFGIHGFFVAEIITEITNYLDIYTLSIKHKKV
ncbi:putative bifunctional diacylglycerol cholinephosphotransferase/ethanolaminephosphotransferase [Clavispora lusitaniae]|uniref:diacylglycerol cholinephosphotransferase n=1 Tax=Clavispora lusitaniae TaxID=36911 RepID=A0AA91Q5B5_CLALS|nr:putative bifunctional diacylglycerol cholinephosphotransferase/ethanolaminephosphotransferase [Clavispora lusitaniae]